MCQPTGGTICGIDRNTMSGNFALSQLFGSLENATQSMAQAKASHQAGERTINGLGGTTPYKPTSSHNKHDGNTSTEEENSIGENSKQMQKSSSIATRVRRKRKIREQGSTEEAVTQHQSTVQHHYHDFATTPTVKSTETTTSSKKSKGGIAFPFPSVLHGMLERADLEGFTDIVSWQPHGRAFTVHNPGRFVKEIMPLFFRQTRFASFQRQLSLYGFLRLTRKGMDHGAYYHELFVRGRADLCQLMQRTRVKGSWVRQSSSPETEPDFDTMPPVPPSPSKAMAKLPPLRQAATTAVKTPSRSSTSTSKIILDNPVTPTPVVHQHTSHFQGGDTYHTPTGFGWSNSNLLSMPGGVPSSTTKTIHEQNDRYQFPNKKNNYHQQASSTTTAPFSIHYYSVPAQQEYFEPPPPVEQASLAAFLFEAGLDSEDEEYDTEPLPWNTPSNLADV